MSELFKLGLCNKYFQGSVIHVMIGFAAVLIIGYLLGSLNFGVIISRMFYNDDVRKHGSGGSGATNMLRTYGRLPAAATFLCDGLKTVAAVFAGALFLGMYNADFISYNGVLYSGAAEFERALIEMYGENRPTIIVHMYEGFAGMYIGGIAALLGHAFPVYYGFKGGRCVASTFFLVLLTEPLVAVMCLAIFIAIVWVTKYISAGSVMCVIVYPLILNRWTGSGLHNLAAIFIALFVVYLHRENIVRLINGRENKVNFRKKEKI
ncbi:MAG: glycerol-3-phosphate 1-O-acyltransferase PlsY [Oscillospiraceae bacterium]|nr:glycerol-3-phosphate 1-O-acyltransferase PlsY [Oscillospiraceae bacterium]